MGRNSFSQTVYSDFSGGFNDTSASIAINDNQLSMSLNADYSAEVKALQTRKGCTKFTSKLNGELLDAFSWIVSSTYKKCVLLYDGAKTYLCDVSSDGSKTDMYVWDKKVPRIYPFVMNNILYFGNGEELYEWGVTDFSTDFEVNVIPKDKIIKYTLETSTKGVKGHFYKHLVTSASSIKSSEENFRNTTNWKDVTDVVGFTSACVREMTPYDASEYEIVTLTLNQNATASDDITVTLNGVEGKYKCTASQDITSIAKGISELSVFATDWNIVHSNNEVVFTAKQKKAMLNTKHMLNPATSGVTGTISVTQEGHDFDCDLSEIKKCTNFCVHLGSQRVFASGSPDDTALYFSEIGKGNYFISTINKVYPAINGYGNVTAMINLSDSLLVSYENGWYSWRGTTPLTDAYWKPLNIPYGCVSPRTLCLTPNSFTFLSRDGIYCVSASILSDEYVLLESSKIIKSLSENTVEHTILDMKNKSTTTAIFYDNVFMIAYESIEDNECKVLKYEWNTSSFTLVTGWKVYAWMSDPEHLYFASSNYVLKCFDGYSDIDTRTGLKKPIHLHVKTKEYHLGTPISNKILQLIGFIFQQHDGIESNVKIRINAGYTHFEFSSQDLAESLMYNRLWGKKWGYRQAIVKLAELGVVSNVFQVELESVDGENTDNPITLIGLGFMYEVSDIITPTIWKDEVLLQ